MSLGSIALQSIDDATNEAVRQGVAMAVAAGNNGQMPLLGDACFGIPARAELALTVGATELAPQRRRTLRPAEPMRSTDARAAFSCYGRCVDVLAPGAQITSAWAGADDATRVASGTSMACPHGAGVLAAQWSLKSSISALELKQEVLHDAADGLVDLACGGVAACENTPNKLLHIPC